MNIARTTAEWLKSRKTLKMFLGIGILLGILLFIMIVSDDNKKNKKESGFDTKSKSPKNQETKIVDEDFHAITIKKQDKPEQRQKEKIIEVPEPPKEKIKIKAVLPLDTIPEKIDANEPVLGPLFAPFGRLVKCELVITIDSGNAVTPIIALVTEDVWHQEQLVIPAGVEVHGMAQGNPLRDRINSQNNWTLVWRTRDEMNGKELQVQGIALEYSKDANSNQWTITDGSAGIPGYMIKGSDIKELVALLATFASGVASGLVTANVYQTNSGTVVDYDGDTKSAIALGVQRAMELYAQRMLRKISQDGYFIRCPAGTEFYLYVTQVINMNDAKIAGSLFNENKKRTDIQNMLRSGRSLPGATASPIGR